MTPRHLPDDEPHEPSAPAQPQPHAGWAARGRVRELEAALHTPGFWDACVRRYLDAEIGTPGDAEIRSWHNSWPPLLQALVRAGLSDLQLYLEYATPGGGQRLDALLLGDSPTGLAAVAIELKQWHTAKVLDDGIRVQRTDGQVTTHPVLQVAAYRRFLQEWLPSDAPRLEVRAALLLHNATTGQGEALRITAGPGADIPVVTGDDLRDHPAAIATHLRCDGLSTPRPHQVDAFEKIAWTPSKRLLDQVGAALQGQTTFTLVGDQQEAFLRIRAAVDHARQGGRGRVITVHGGPGSGKTALAVRLLAHLMRHPDAAARYVTPSGTLRAHLCDAAADAAARDLFLPASRLHFAVRTAQVLIIDEAQRLVRRREEIPTDLAAAIRDVPVLVIFLDERQVIRPGEGTTVAEIAATAAATGRTHLPLNLNGSFRCGGSKAFTSWVENLLYDIPTPWNDPRYDVALSPDPFSLQQWVDDATDAGHLARISAGFCWQWTRTNTLHHDVVIETEEHHAGRTRRWSAPWNANSTVTAADGTPTAPRSQMWATQPGGHRQIGCIYTAQGLEYQYAGAIIGPDLIWRNGRWRGVPTASHDDKLRKLSPEHYLPLALNTYRVLLTRGTEATRIHATDPETRRHLNTLIHERTTTTPHENSPR